MCCHTHHDLDTHFSEFLYVGFHFELQSFFISFLPSVSS
jgi:hypothetical protein